MADFYEKYHSVFDQNVQNQQNLKVSEPNYVFDLNRVPLRNMAPFNKEYGQPYNYSVLPFVQNDVYKKQYESPS